MELQLGTKYIDKNNCLDFEIKMSKVKIDDVYDETTCDQ